MSYSNPKRLRAEGDLSKPLRDALRDPPNADPSAAQLESLRVRLGLRAAARDEELPARLVSLSSQGRPTTPRTLRRTIAALVLFPVAAAAAVGGVVELVQRASAPTNVAAPNAAAIAANQRQHAQPGAAVAAALPALPTPLVADGVTQPVTEPARTASPIAQRTANSGANDELPGSPPIGAPALVLSSSGVPPVAAFEAAPASSTALAAEIALLERANATLKAAPATALALATQHRQAFPTGNLAQEREVIVIKALHAMGETQRAREGLASFERAYPRSAHVLELRQIVR